MTLRSTLVMGLIQPSGPNAGKILSGPVIKGENGGCS